MYDIRRDGYALFCGAIPPDLLAQSQVAFDHGYLPSPDWPTPRGKDWRHARVDLDPAIMAIARLPQLLEAAGALIGAPFFLMQIEGREPLQGNPAQPLHRDAEGSEYPFAVALIYLDDYGPDNGATQLVPGSHTGPDEAAPLVLSGRAGDICLLDANLLHGATSNISGARRRMLLATYADIRLRPDLVATEALRGVRMDTSEVFGTNLTG
jgi:ectoine hydroxylase-related dioxygenase (phytanoyl-CoA dioxygenase family)